MSDLGARLRSAATVYDQSYPPSVYGPPDPNITSLTPNTVSAAAGATTITVTGSNFAAGSVVEINQAAQPTTYVSPTSLTVSYDPTVAGTVTFTVRNVNNEESNSVPFTVGALGGFASVEAEPGEPEPVEYPAEPETTEDDDSAAEDEPDEYGYPAQEAEGD